MNRYLIHLILFFTLPLMSGCIVRPLKPGVSSTATGGLQASLKQSENPQQSSSQVVEETLTPIQFPSPPIGSNLPPMAVTRRTTTTIGAAQKDTAREVGAYLRGMSGLMYIGAALLLFGVGSMFYPPLKALIGSTTTSMAIAAVGVALIALPSVIADPKIRIGMAVAVCAGIVYLYVHTRNAQKQGELNAIKEHILRKVE